MVFCGWRILENPYFANSNGLLFHLGSGVGLQTRFLEFFRFIYGVGKSDLQPLGFHIQEFPTLAYLASFNNMRKFYLFVLFLFNYCCQ